MTVELHDKRLDDSLEMVEEDKAQLPDSQRSWVQDGTKMCKLIESVTSGFPMDAAMSLANGGEHIRFRYHTFEVVNSISEVMSEWLVLDEQQRLTTLCQALESKRTANTRLKTNRGTIIKCYYYLDIYKYLGPTADKLEAIISVSEKKQLTASIGRNATLDLSTREKEFESLMFPLNTTFSHNDTEDWHYDVGDYYRGDREYRNLFRDFSQQILHPILEYDIPIIQLDKETPREAVCQILENINTSGVLPTVFEFVTAIFAAEGHELRKDWETVRHIFARKVSSELLKEITGANFLAAITLLVSYYKRVVSGDDECVAVTYRKKGILRLELKNYLKYHDALVKGFCDATDFLVHRGVFRSRDLPYSSQLIPLAAISTYDNENKKMLHLGSKQELLSRWYRYGVMGELYGSANETRFATDIMSVFCQMEGGEIPETIYHFNIQPTHLLAMQARNSAAYKSVMALILQDSSLDFMTDHRMDIVSYIDEDADIHHMLLQTYCEENSLPRIKQNFVINKTSIYVSPNRSVREHVPSTYIRTMANKGLKQVEIQEAIESHKVSYTHLALDDFDAYFIDRAKQLLDRIEQVTDRSISGRGSKGTIHEFDVALIQIAICNKPEEYD